MNEYIKVNILDEQYLFRKDVVLELLRKYPENFYNYVDPDSLQAMLVDSIIDEYYTGYDDEEIDIVDINILDNE